MPELFGLTLTLPLPLTFYPIPFALIFWGVYIWTQRGERRPNVDIKQQRDTGGALDSSSWLIINWSSRISRGLALLVAFVVPAWGAGIVRIETFLLGIVLMVAGTLIRRECFRLLQDSFTARVEAPKENKIVEAGLYRWVRHPSYTGGMLFIIGFGVAMTNWVSLAIMIAGGVLMYAYRVPIEERALVSALGQPYADYMNRTKRFVPNVF